jgi:hypothetical protein
MELLNRRNALSAGLAGALAALFRPARALAGAADSGYAWKEGDVDSFIAGGAGASAGTITVQASGDFDVVAHHVRFGTFDGNYEFEHSHSVPETHLNSYYVGTPTRTPISVGGDDGQDVLSFVVRGHHGQKHDLQQWAPSGKVTAAIDGNGNLRLGPATLTVEVVNGYVELVAQVTGGKRVVLARAKA